MREPSRQRLSAWENHGNSWLTSTKTQVSPERKIPSRARVSGNRCKVLRTFIIPSSETQGQIKGASESLNGWKNIYGTKKSKERREEPLGTMSYQTSSNGRRRSGFWLVPENLCFSGTRGSSRRSLLFFVSYFSARLDFPSSPLSAPGSPRMVQGRLARNYMPC